VIPRTQPGAPAARRQLLLLLLLLWRRLLLLLLLLLWRRRPRSPRGCRSRAVCSIRLRPSAGGEGGTQQQTER